MTTVVARPGDGLRPAGWLALACVSSLVSLYGFLRFANELGISPLHFVVEDALFALLGVLAAWASVARLRRARARLRAARSWVGILESPEHALAHGDDSARSEVAGFQGTHFETTATATHLLVQSVAAAVLLAVGCFLVAGAMLGKDLIWPWVLGLVLLYSGLALLASTLRVHLSARPTIRMDATGFEHILFGAVPWAGVEDVRLGWVPGVRGSPRRILELVLAPDVRVTGRPFWLLGWHPKARLQVPVRWLDQPPEQIEAAAVALRARGGPPRSEAPLPFSSPAWREGLREQARVLARLEEIGRETGYSEAGVAETLQLLETLDASMVQSRAARGIEQQRLRRRVTAMVGLLFIVALAIVFLLLARH